MAARAPDSVRLFRQRPEERRSDRRAPIGRDITAGWAQIAVRAFWATKGESYSLIEITAIGTPRRHPAAIVQRPTSKIRIKRLASFAPAATPDSAPGRSFFPARRSGE